MTDEPAFRIGKYGSKFELHEGGWTQTPPCNALSDDDEPCAFDGGHEGGHSWEPEIIFNGELMGRGNAGMAAALRKLFEDRA